MPINPAIIGGGLKLLGGLFGGGGGDHSPAKPDENLVLHAKGARDAARYGFNPLTLLGLGGQGYGPSGGPPPLASLSVLGDFVTDNFGSEAKTRQEHNKLQNELLRLEVDRARAVAPVASLPSAARGGSLNGGWGGTKLGSYNNSHFALNNAALTPGRADVVDPQRHASGIIQYDNALTGPVTLVGDDGDPFLEYLQVPLAGGFQVANNWAKRVALDYAVPMLEKWGAKRNENRVEEYLKKFPFGRDANGRPLPKPN